MTVPYEATCISSIARTVMEKRYLIKDETGKVTETPSELFWRVATAVAEAEPKDQREAWAKKFYELMAKGKFEPNTPTLVNAGRGNGLALSACFVLPISDSLVVGRDSIYQTLTNMAAIHQSGGGTGFSFSRLRPEGDIVKSTTGVSSGPVSFMKLYDASTNVVKQGGVRRGANMAIMHCTHPDIMKFITCKADVTQITNFNISVAATDAFMEAVRNDTEYNLVNPKTKKVVKSIRAREVFDAIVTQAHSTGEPGLFFIDKANAANPVPFYGSYEATNPCGEQPLLPYDVCNLGSINIGAYVEFDMHGIPGFNLDAFTADIYTSVRFLDDVIDINPYPLEEIYALSQNIRRIGLGVMGWADFLVRMGIPYDSEEALQWAENVAKAFEEASEAASHTLAEEKGTFPSWPASMWGPEWKGERIKPVKKMRNCNVTTVAPTGTISIIAGCSGGIEPLFSVAFYRNQAGSKMVDYNNDFRNHLNNWGLNSKTVDEVLEQTALTGEIPDTVDELIRKLFVCSHNVEPTQHVKMQAIWQKYIHSAVSKTINLPNSATIEDVSGAYLLAYDLKCKGITVYRDGSRPEQVLSTGKTTAKAAPTPTPEPIVDSRAISGSLKGRSDIVYGFTRKIKFASLGTVFVTVNVNEDGDPVETFIHWGKAGSDEKALAEGLGRVISLALQHGIEAQEVSKALIGIGGKTLVFHHGGTFSSIPDAVGKTLNKAGLFLMGQEEKVNPQITYGLNPSCPECGNEMEKAEGCNKCLNCGFSSCG